MKRFVGVLIFVFGIAVGVLAANLFIFIKTPSGDSEQTVLIERGTPLNKTIAGLEERGVILNGVLFKALVLFKRAAPKIRAGEYVFPPHLKPGEVLALLMKGDFATRRITLPEGWTAREIAKYLSDLGLVRADVFLAKCADAAFIQSLGLSVTNLEGYLYPDTYEIYRPKNEEEVLKKLADRFRTVYTPEMEQRATVLGLSQNQVVTLASIVEKETAKAEERPIVASVFFNRLKKEMPLASDPTVIYGIPNFDGNLTKQHLTTPSPYNTYLNAGLPPTPIANPGIKSIRAVLHPSETDYLYFVSKNDGTHQFSKTEEEHQAAVRRYQLGRP